MYLFYIIKLFILKILLSMYLIKLFILKILLSMYLINKNKTKKKNKKKNKKKTNKQYIYIIKEGRNMFNNIIYNHTMLLQPHLYGITKVLKKSS
ncbi:hypothetical protein C923_00961 [Plasmodium falciparum UGT5.1]|uniref:Uncharacterized protein n=1 Tax=Plasmodium falciparum UGT5.1 TaxID=1237627 RepID=W7JTE6_PLAFA|nr:hypothetical protein C923_00961 [Plasmodium falciparum UGT5.1]